MVYVSWKKQAILAGALFFLGSFAYWYAYNHKPKTEEKTAQANLPFDLKEQAVSSIHIKNGSDQFSFECLDLATSLCKPGDHSKWKMTEPLQTTADATNVNSALTTFNNLSSAENISLKEESPEKQASLLKDYWLDDASREGKNVQRIEFKLKSGDSYVLHFGRVHPLGGKFFVGLSKNGKFDALKVYILASHIQGTLSRNLTYWRDKRLFSWTAGELSEFTLKTFSLAPIRGVKKDYQWKLETKERGKTLQVAGDLEAVENLLTAALFLTTKEFHTAKMIAGAKEIATLTLQKEKAEPLTLKIYEKKKDPKTDQIFASINAREPIFEVDSAIKEKLLKEVKDLRVAKLITTEERYNSKRLELSGGPWKDRSLVLTNKDGDWFNSGDAQMKIDSDKVSEFLDQIAGNRIQDDLDPQKTFPEEKSGLTLKLGDSSNGKQRHYVFFKALEQRKENLYARDLASPNKELYKLDPTIKDSFPQSEDAFVKKAEKPALPGALPTAPAEASHK